MNETKNINHCERAVELVAYFYNEATRDERESFDAHLACCADCRDELSAFAGVREAVGHWRAEILSAAPASLANAAATTTTPVRSERDASVTPRAASALAALREFFTLSPVWMRAGLVAAALVVCALAALAVVNAEVRWDNGGVAFNTRLSGEAKPTQTQVAAPVAKASSPAELDNLRAERDAALRELEDTRAQLDDSRAANLIAAVETVEPVSESSTRVSTPNNSRRERRTAAPPANTRQPRLRNDRDEEYVPRLYDLLIEAN